MINVILLLRGLTVRCVVNYACFFLYMCYHSMVNKVEYNSNLGSILHRLATVRL